MFKTLNFDKRWTVHNVACKYGIAKDHSDERLEMTNVHLLTMRYDDGDDLTS